MASNTNAINNTLKIIINSVDTTQDKAVITWTTGAPAQSYMYFNAGALTINQANPPVGTAGSVWSDVNFVTTHITTLIGLTSRTHYNCVLYVKDRRGNVNTMTESFDTK